MSTNHKHLNRFERTTLYWLDVLILAFVVLVVVLAVSANGSEVDMPEPAPLPAGIDKWAEPMPTTPVDMDEVLGPAFECEAVASVHAAIAAHRDGDDATAITLWGDTPLVLEADGWRYLAMTDAWLNRGEVFEAQTALEQAATLLGGDHPLVNFYAALVRLEQARDLRDWPDAVGPSPFRLVSTDVPNTLPYVPAMPTPNTKSAYEMMAIESLEKVVASQQKINYAQPLEPALGAPHTAPCPQVSDLLVAMGVDSWREQSLMKVSRLCLERGLADRAEGHLDTARETGLDVEAELVALSDYYKVTGRWADSFRAFAKSLPSERIFELPQVTPLHDLEAPTVPGTPEY